MFRLALLTALLALLAGCVTHTREVVYRDRYYDADGYVQTTPREQYRDGSYYSPALSGRGDYYYGASYGYDSAWYWDHPAYYSVFWPLYHRWYDPFWHPGFYYGVTYYPRSYFSIGLHRGWGTLHYSPYRHAWVDNYYDWSPWRHRHHRRHERDVPRYGSALNEAERLARMGYPRRHDGRGEPAAADSALRPRERFGTMRAPHRAADYGSLPGPRQDPGVTGFGAPASEVRRVGAGARSLPGGAAPEPHGDAGATSYRMPSRGAWRAEPNGTRNAGSWRSEPMAPRRWERSTRADGTPVESLPGPRDYRRGARYGEAAPLPRAQPRYVAPARNYESPPGDYAPQPRVERAMPSYTPRAAPAYVAPAPRYEARPAPSWSGGESRGDSGWSRGESRSDSSHGGRSSDEGVRRVGSNRDD